MTGGVAEGPDSVSEVLGRYHKVWLKASPTEHMERVRLTHSQKKVCLAKNDFVKVSESFFASVV